MGFSLKRPSNLDRLPDFQPYQIVCLEHENRCLYAEVIQIVEARQICWVRPLLLISQASLSVAAFEDSEQLCWYDLRQGADLLWPLVLFRPALDTEVLPVLNHLYQSSSGIELAAIAATGRQQLTQFIQQVWQAYPEAFQE